MYYKISSNMKKALLFFGVFSAFGVTYSQQRLVLAESFSQASCGPCAAQNPALTTLLNANTTKIVAVKYQVSWPGYDPMYNHNPTEIDTRVSYYGINGVPDRVMDGTNMDVTQGAIDSRYAVASPVSMTITHNIDPGFATADITVTITAPAVWNPTNTVLQLAMVEKDIIFASAPGSNGETGFHNVMRKMLPGTSGSAVVASNFSSPGGTQTFTFTDVAIPSYIYDLGELSFVAWIQDNTTKEVHQAGVSLPVVLDDYAVVQSLSVPSTYSCATDLSGATAVLSNDGATAITSATVNYQIDGGTVQTAPFSGNIAPGGTTNFAIPTTASPSGSHTLTSYLTNINGSGSSSPIGTATTTFANISDPGTTGNFSQNFTSSAFPYTNYHIASTTGDNWVRSTANTGCIKYDNYTFAAGKKGDTYIAPIDMTSISSANMTFDVAYRQYQAENDKLEVFVSSDCGATWTSVYSKQGTTLSTGAAQTAGFTPAASSDWRNETVSLASYASASKLHIKFTATSQYGNNLYVDNINIAAAGVNELNQVGMDVYPNPASDVVNVKFEGKGGNYEIAITDLAGRTISTQSVTNAEGAQNVAISVNDLKAGNYIVTVKTEGAVSTQKVVVQ